MSVGNVNTNGDKLNNYTWQSAMLQMLGKIYSALGGSSGGGGATVQIITSSSETGSTNSPVTAGATSVTFTTSSSFAGTINGVARAVSTTYPFEAALGKTLPAIPYTVTAGSVIIDKTI